MKRQWFAISGLCMLFAVVAWAEDEPAAKSAKPKEEAKAAAGELKTVAERGSYAFGYTIGRNFASQGVEMDVKLVAKGMAAAFGESKPLLTDEQIQTAMQEFQEELRAKAQAKAKAMAGDNKKKGDAFLAENKKKKGITTTKSGLQYEVIKEGDGPSPKKTDKVTAHYHGTLLDGKVFDSSVQRNEPLEIGVSDVIKGWTEALQLMKVGSKWKLYIPSELAYGENGPPGIGPNTTLIFEVELISIN
jgi:FKBP-type peptidyl-prolyl cis-trans isomerase